MACCSPWGSQRVRPDWLEGVPACLLEGGCGGVRRQSRSNDQGQITVVHLESPPRVEGVNEGQGKQQLPAVLPQQRAH